MKLRLLAILGTGVLLAVLLGCSSQTSSQTGEISSAEREQIQNVVRQYVTQNGSIPQYSVRVEKTEKDWALVSVKPEGTNTKLTYFYLRRSSGGGAAAAAPSLSPAATSVAPGTVPPQFNQNPPPLSGSTPPVVATSGWVIVLGPKETFAKSELAAAGVPPDLIPQSTDAQ